MYFLLLSLLFFIIVNLFIAGYKNTVAKTER